MGRGRGLHRRDPHAWEGGGVAAKGQAPPQTAPPLHLPKNTSVIPPTPSPRHPTLHTEAQRVCKDNGTLGELREQWPPRGLSDARGSGFL